MRRPALLLPALSLLVSAGIGFGVTHTLAENRAASSVLTLRACSSCPKGVRVTSVAVEARQGSTLFIVNGSWPAHIGDIPADVRFRANDVQIALRPLAGPEAFQILAATRGGVPLPPADFAVSLRPGSLLLDVDRDSLRTPMSFAIELDQGNARLGGVPDSGQLRWTGRGAPVLQR